MASAAACYSCGANVNDATGMSQLQKLNRMISDNYTIVVIAIIILIIIVFVIKYFAGQIVQVMKNYKRASREKQDNSAQLDQEIYDPDSKIGDPKLYFDKPKSEYVKDLEQKFKEYNNLKDDYVKTNFSKMNDDLVDSRILYKKNDSYSYSQD